MIYCRFSTSGEPQYGMVETVAGQEQITHILPGGEGGVPDVEGGHTIPAIPLASAPLLAPVQPTKIICSGRNYLEWGIVAQLLSLAEPLIFMKPPSSIIAHGATILRPRVSQRVEFGGELAVVIAKRCSNLRDDEDVRGYIAGYTIANGVTARDLEESGDQGTRARGFDTFCPVGPVVNDGLDPWRGVSLESRVNGKQRQLADTVDFIFPLDVLLRYISRRMTMLRGDLVLTGAPAGGGPLVAGDVVEVTIGGLGTLRNPVADAP